MTDAPAAAPAAAVPTIRLAGRDWPVPPLAIRQNRVVVPGLLKLMPVLTEFQAALPAGAGQPIDPLWWTKVSLTTETIDTLSDVVFEALRRGTPGLVRNEFDGIEMTPFDLLGAIPVVLAATGMFRPAEPGRVGEPTGEAAPPTSTPSSATS